MATSFTSDYGADVSAIERRKHLAALLQQQGMQPIEQQPTPQGGFAVPISPWQGATKIAQALAGTMQAKRAEGEQRSLGERSQRDLADVLMRSQKLATGTPAQTIQPDPQEAAQTADYGTPQVAPANIPAVPPNRQAQIDLLMGNQLTRPAAMHMMQQQPMIEQQQKKQEEDQLFRMQQADEARKQQEAMARLQASMRPEPAPTMSEVLDPKDPTRMLRVDARTYKGGSLGAVGVLGVSGKEPTAAKHEEQVGQGRQTVSDLVSQLGTYYDDLAKGGGIADPSKGTLANVRAGIATSGLGQTAGRVVGTENQSIRDSIAQTRPLLLNAIRSATGMSAKQMDSNAELKLYLAAATDPSLGLSANKRALAMLDKLYGLSGRPQQRAPTPQQPQQPRIVDW